MILYGKWKNKHGKILRMFVDERGVPMIELEPVPKGRKQNRLMGLYNIWQLPERRLPKKQAASVVARWFTRVGSYSDEFLKAVSGRRFRNPETGEQVLFKSLPPEEQGKVHEHWERANKQHDESSAASVSDDDIADAMEYLRESFEKEWSLDDFERSPVTRMSTDEVSSYDDFGSWTEWSKGELKEMSPSERRDALESFRGKGFADRAEKWIEEGRFPPVILVDSSEGSAVADGRGRVSVALGMGMPVDAVVLTEKSLSSKTASSRTACIIAGKRFGGDLCLFKNRDRSYDTKLQVFHMEFNGVEMAFVLDLETGFLEGVNEHGIGIVNTTLSVVRDESEGPGKKTTVSSKEGPKIFMALMQRTLDDAVASLLSFEGGIRGHTLVADRSRLVGIEKFFSRPAHVQELDAAEVNARTNNGIVETDSGYTHGEDYVSSVVRRSEAERRLRDIDDPMAVAPALTRLVDDPDSPFNPVRITDHMRTTSQLVVDTTNPALFLYLIPGHATLEPAINLLPNGRAPKIPVRIFRYKQKMEERAAPWLKKATYEMLAKARYKSKKTVKTKDGDDMVVYEYGPRQVANRNKEKAERVEHLRKQISKLRAKVKRDLTAADDHVRAVALAVALMDATYERVGNDASAKEGHFGVTTWKVKHIKFKGKKAIFTYVGKSGVDHVKEVDEAGLVKALRAACKDKKDGDCLIDVSAPDVNEYLEPFDITAKDLRGFHANREMKERLKAVRSKGPKLPEDRKEREALLKEEFKEALAETAEAVGHTESTLRSQYLVPGLEDDFMKDGTVKAEHTKKARGSVLVPTGERAMGSGLVYTMPLRDDLFVHFTPSARALEILRSKKLLMHPPHEKFGIDAVSAVSTTYGKFVPGVQTTHIKGDDVVALVFSTNTLPERGYVEEVIWKQDVTLLNPKLLPAARAAALLRSTPVHLGDQDMVVYNRTPAPRVASLRTAAEDGTLLERKMLAAALHAPVFVARDRNWWLTHAPNVYRIARDLERPRPFVEGLQFPPEMFATLWYENEEGERMAHDPDGIEAPHDAFTQHSQFPNVLQHSILLLNDDGTSSSLGTGSSSFSPDLVNAMVRSGDWDVADAIMVAAQSCERCGNVLHHHYKTGDGYPFGSEEYWKAGTSCDMCQGVTLGTKTAAPKYEEYVRRKEQQGEHPLKRDEWEARVLGVDEPASAAEPPSKEEWETFRKNTLATHSLEKLWTSYRPEERMLSVDNIGVAQEHRGKGHAGRAMKDVLAWADKHGVTVSLSPTSDFGSSKKRLEQWYRSLGFVPNKGRSKDFRTRDSMVRIPKASKQATKTPAEVEDEKAQKMLRPEPKKKPPRYDLRNNRTLEDDDPDFDGLGGGDRGDPDQSMKWNKVAQRVAFRWLAVPRASSAARVALQFLAKEEDKSEFEQAVSSKKFRHPDTGNNVEFHSLPADEQARIYERWKDSQVEDLSEDAEPEDEEDLTEDAEETEDEDLTDDAEVEEDSIFAPQEDEEDPEDEQESSEELEKSDDAAEEGGRPYTNDSPEEAPAAADGADELDRARDKIQDLQSHVDRIQREMAEGRENIEALLKLVDKASPKNRENIEQKVKEEKKKLRGLEDELEDKTGQLEEAKALVKSLKKPRQPAPEETPAEQPRPAEKKKRKKNPPPRDEETSESVDRALADARQTMESLLGPNSDVSRDLQQQIETVLHQYDNDQVQQFSDSLREHMRKLVSSDPSSGDAIRLANRAAELEDLGGDSDPVAMAERIAGMAFARNVVANPMVLAGEPVGGHEIDDKKYGQRAQQAFDHYGKLHKSLRRHAAEEIARQLRDLEPDSNKAQELEAILTGINTAHVADLGEALPGRPQPSAGHTALVRKLVETGNASHMFRPLEDFFADDSRRAMSEALREMDAKDLGSFILGENDDHPFSSLQETLNAPGINEYKQMIKDFLIQDFLNDTWGDRAVRDVMQAAGMDGAADPAARAKVLAESKQEAASSVHAALAAMERVADAKSRGEDPDPADEELARASFEGDGASVLRHNAETLLKLLRQKVQKHVISPALAVLEHFVKNKDPEALARETVPHPDDDEQVRSNPRDDAHEAGDVWRTDAGNWRAKNEEGVPKTFQDRQEADIYAGRGDDWSADFNEGPDESPREGPSKFAADVASAWLRRLRSIHPDDPRRPVFVRAA